MPKSATFMSADSPQILRDHPLASGMVGAFLFNGKGGSRVYNIVNYVDFLTVLGATYGYSRIGQGLICSGFTKYARLTTLPNPFKLTSEVTIMWYGVILGDMSNGVNNPNLFAVNPNNTDATPFASYSICRRDPTGSGSQKLFYFIWNNGSFQSYQSAQVVQYGKPTMLVLTLSTRTGKLASIYKDGLLLATGQAATGTISYSGTAMMNVGSNATEELTNDANSLTHMTGVWNRALSANEVRCLWEAPYQFVSAPVSKSFGTTLQFSSPTGPKSGSAFTDDNSNGGNVAWTNPGNAQLSDNIYATSVLLLGQVTDYLKALGFGFYIPSTHSIDGIVVEIERKSGLTSNTVDSEVKLVKGGIVGGTNKASGTNWPTAEAYFTYGNSSDLWGQTWTPADINASTFGAVLSATVAAGDTVSVDHIRITVYHSVHAGAVTTGIMTTRSGWWGDL